MKTDRELLELAAKAAGIECLGGAGWRLPCGQSQAWWNPRTDDGDCARLESALLMDVDWHETSVSVRRRYAPKAFAVEEYADHGGDKQAARRVAALRCAAAIEEAAK